MFFLFCILFSGPVVSYSQDTLVDRQNKLKINVVSGSSVVETTWKRQRIKATGVMWLINITRLATLRHPLISSGTWRLKRSAYNHSFDMARSGRFGHYGFEKRSLQFNFDGENVHYSSNELSISFIIYLDWLFSIGHRKNMLNYGHLFTGIGICKQKVKIKSHINGKWKTVSKKNKVYSTQVFR